jgi:hypothetical protein
LCALSIISGNSRLASNRGGDQDTIMESVSVGRCLWLVLLASALPVADCHDGAAATLTVGVLLLLLFCCTGICCMSGLGVYTLCRGGVHDYDPECDEARARRESD